MATVQIHKSYLPGIRGTDRYSLFLEGEYIPLLSVDETADALRVSSKTVRRLLSDGKLSHLRVGRRVLLRTEDVDRFIRMQCLRAPLR